MKKLSKSFFDNNAKAIDSFWEKEELNVNQKMVQYECLLFQKSSKTGFWISRNYCVLNNKLVKFNVTLSINQTNTNKVCFVNLNLARVELIKYKNSSEKEKDHKVQSILKVEKIRIPCRKEHATKGTLFQDKRIKFGSLGSTEKELNSDYFQR